MIIEDESIKTEVKFSDREEDTLASSTQGWRGDEEEQDAYSLFAIDEETDPNDLEIQSFSFETEDRREEPKTNSSTPSYSQEKPVEFSFFVNEPISEPRTDFGQPKAEFSTPTNT